VTSTGRRATVLAMLLASGMPAAVAAGEPPMSPVAAESAAGDSVPGDPFTFDSVADGAAAAAQPAADRGPRTGILRFAPSGGILGEQPFFALRGAYAIAGPVDLEAEIGHNIGEVTSAFLHSAGVRVNGFRWQRAQTFATAGFGTFSAAESDAIAAKSVTRSHLRLGGGVEYAVRDDLGIRLDLRHHRVLLGGSDAGNEVSLGVNEVSLGLVFSRRIWSPPSSGSVTP